MNLQHLENERLPDALCPIFFTVRYLSAATEVAALMLRVQSIRALVFDRLSAISCDHRREQNPGCFHRPSRCEFHFRIGFCLSVIAMSVPQSCRQASA